MQPRQNKYLETSIRTASPAQLLIILYDGAIRFSKMAVNALREGNFQEAHNDLIRAQNIISEFAITLERNSPLSGNLLSLYEYFNRRLTEANIHKQTEPIEEVIGYLTEMKATWMQAAIIARNPAAASDPAEQPAVAGARNG